MVVSAAAVVRVQMRVVVMHPRRVRVRVRVGVRAVLLVHVPHLPGRWVMVVHPVGMRMEMRVMVMPAVTVRVVMAMPVAMPKPSTVLAVPGE